MRQPSRFFLLLFLPAYDCQWWGPVSYKFSCLCYLLTFFYRYQNFHRYRPSGTNSKQNGPNDDYTVIWVLGKLSLADSDSDTDSTKSDLDYLTFKEELG